MKKELITKVLLNETNRTDYKVKDTRDFPTIIALYGKTADCMNEFITPALTDFSQKTGLPTGVLEIDLSLATNYDEVEKIWKEQTETYKVKEKNVIILHKFTKLPAIFGYSKLERIISSWLRKAVYVYIGDDDNGWTGWHLIMITDEDTDDWLEDSCWTYFRQKGCLNVYKL